MKKNIIFSLLAILVLALGLTGCSPVDLNFIKIDSDPYYLVDQEYTKVIYGNTVVFSKMEMPPEVLFLSITTDRENKISINGISEYQNKEMRTFTVPVSILLSDSSETIGVANVSVEVVKGISDMVITLPKQDKIAGDVKISEIKIGEVGISGCYIFGKCCE